ncbi:TetR family transcriptional regulator [Streptomyces sp. SCSIO 30461]|uniref:TetR/AcrR family transcriptional regulator n=1 Tax=Streptomyces sp. SCSIO 30461 TaxID=3118085 RepID=UPI0030D3CFD5
MGNVSKAAERRQRILRAAGVVFSEHGYAGASMAQIAAAAGASKETLYSYFGDKLGLLREALTSLVQAPDRAATPALSAQPASPEEFESLLGDIAQALVADLMQPAYLALARVVVAETPRTPGLADQFKAAVADRAIGEVAAVLNAGRERGLVDPDIDTEPAARALIGSLLTYVLLDGLLRHPSAIQPPTADAIRAQVALFHRAVRAPHHPDRETS